LRAARGGQRLLSLCYGGTIPFVSASAIVLSTESPTATYIGTTTAVTGDPPFPTHFFWLSYPPMPGSSVLVQINLDELHREPWVETHSRLRLITGDTPALRFVVAPRRSFREVRGYRLASDGSEPVQEFRTGRRGKGELPAYKPEAKSGDEAFHMHCIASDKCITHQRRLKRASHIPL